MTRRYLLDTGPAQDFLFQRRGIQDRVEAARAAARRSEFALQSSARSSAAWKAATAAKPRGRSPASWPRWGGCNRWRSPTMWRRIWMPGNGC